MSLFNRMTNKGFKRVHGMRTKERIVGTVDGVEVKYQLDAGINATDIAEIAETVASEGVKVTATETVELTGAAADRSRSMAFKGRAAAVALLQLTGETEGDEATADDAELAELASRTK
jgi:hypothetical protein